MKDPLLERVRRKLDEAFDSSQWGRAFSSRAVLDETTRFNPDAGGLVGGVSLYVTGRDGREALVHHEPMGVLRTTEDVDDWLARALSVFLEQHPRWPV